MIRPPTKPHWSQLVAFAVMVAIGTYLQTRDHRAFGAMVIWLAVAIPALSLWRD